MLCKNCGTVEAPSGADYCDKCDQLWLRADMSRDEQEALSRRYCNDIIILLPLKSGNIAVFNNESRTLCGVIEDLDAGEPRHTTWREVLDTWRRPKPIQSKAVNLKELGLLE